MKEVSKKKDNGLNNLIINIILPALILMKGAKWAAKFNLDLSSLQILLIALAFPFFYGLYDLIIKKEKNFISALGFISILLTGVVGVFELPVEYIAIKEAAIPFIIGCVLLISNYTPYPLAPKFLYNDEVFNKPKINAHLNEKEKKSLTKIIKKASFYLFLSFILSAILNYAVAKYFVISPSGTEAFNNEMGKMSLYSYPIIVAPSMLIMVAIIRYIYISIKKLTELTSDDIFMFKS